MTTKKVGLSSITTYTYDDINRLDFTNYPSSDTPDVAVTYDGNSNIKRINSGIANITYTYDANNNLIKEQQNIDNKNYFLNYTYNGLDYLSSITYADNGVISYSPNELGWPTKAEPYVNDIDYDAFGRPIKFEYANGRNQTQSYWARGWPRRTIVDGGISDRERVYDDAGNLTSMNDRLNNFYDRTMTYDDLSRIKTAEGAWGNGTINYSTDDDITSKSMGTNSLSYSYSSSKNRITSVNGVQNFIGAAQYDYDVYGNIIKKANSANTTGWLYDYDDASNLREIFDTNNNLLRTYDYSGQKQRVRSIKPDETRIHIVSKSGQLMNEFVTSGSKPDVANVYVGSRLVAELSGESGPATIFGWGFGNSDHKTAYSPNFNLDKVPGSVKLCVDGYGISYNTEVSVSVNGDFVGYMKSGADPTQTCFDVPKDSLLLGSNSITFTQTNIGQTWGVGNILVESITAPYLPIIIMMLLEEDEEAAQ